MEQWGKIGLENLIGGKLVSKEEKNMEYLLFVLESHFDHDKKSGNRMKVEKSKIIGEKESNNKKIIVTNFCKI